MFVILGSNGVKKKRKSFNFKPNPSLLMAQNTQSGRLLGKEPQKELQKKPQLARQWAD